MKITLRGSTSVVKNHLGEDQEDVTSPEILREIAIKNDDLQSLYDEDYALSQFLHDGSELANSLQQRLKLGGWVRLVFCESEQGLFVETDYEVDGELTAEEIAFLVKETLGQWSDGGGGSAMDDFSEFIDPYYVELDEYEPENVVVTLS